MRQSYVERRDAGYWISASRVSLDSIVYAFQQGCTAEAIAQSFPAISLDQVYGAIAYYLGCRQEIDDYLARVRADYEVKRQAARDADPAYYLKMAQARQQAQPS